MLNDGLVAGVKKHLQRGDSYEVIRRHVLEAGYSESDFRQAYLVSAGSTYKESEPASPNVQMYSDHTTPAVANRGVPASTLVLSLVFITILISIGLVFTGTGNLNSFKNDIFSKFSNYPVASEDIENIAGCLIDESPEVKAIKSELVALEERIKTLNAESDSKYSTGTSSSWQAGLAKIKEIDILTEKYASTSSQLTKLAMNAIDQQVIDKVYREYCTGSSSLVSLDITLDGSLEVIESTAKADPVGLVCSLDQHKIEDNKVHQALNQVGMYHVQVGNFDRGMDFYHCSAERYYNPMSMYRLAQLYWYGSNHLVELMSKDGTEVKIMMPIERDIDRAYYWIVAQTWTAIYLKSPHVDAGTGYGWNSIALLDSMQQSSGLSSQTMIDQEEKAIEFLAPKFPQIISEKSRVYSHSMRAIIGDSGEGGVGREDELPTVTKEPSKNDSTVKADNFLKSDIEIKNILGTMRASAELYYDKNQDVGYEGLCNAILNKELSPSGLDYSGIDYVCRAPSKNTYLISASLSNGEYCIDSTGFAGNIPASPKSFTCQ